MKKHSESNEELSLKDLDSLAKGYKKDSSEFQHFSNHRLCYNLVHVWLQN